MTAEEFRQVLRDELEHHRYAQLRQKVTSTKLMGAKMPPYACPCRSCKERPPVQTTTEQK
jgi:hypothetical protein